MTYDFDHMFESPFSQLPSRASRRLDVLQGDVLFRQGQQTSGLYRVLSGRVTLQRTSLAGDTLTLHSAVAGGYFAEASVFSDSYHCDAICTRAGSVLKIGKADIVELMQTSPDFCIGFTRLLAVQVQSYRTHIELLAIRSAKDRVLAAVQAGYLDATVTSLAARINLTHEACYRALRTLCDESRLDQTGPGRYVLSTVEFGSSSP